MNAAHLARRFDRRLRRRPYRAVGDGVVLPREELRRIGASDGCARLTTRALRGLRGLRLVALLGAMHSGSLPHVNDAKPSLKPVLCRVVACGRRVGFMLAAVDTLAIKKDSRCPCPLHLNNSYARPTSPRLESSDAQWSPLDASGGATGARGRSPGCGPDAPAKPKFQRMTREL